MPIAKQNTQANLAYQELKKRILMGFFGASDRLREIEVAELLNMGRTPVREALKRLEDEGLLTHEPRRGLVVTSLDQQSVTELYAMRELLEGGAARFAAKHASEAEIDNMAHILEEGRQGGDPVEANLAFHQSIYGAAHNKFLIRALRSLTDSTYLLGRSTLEMAGRPDAAHGEHRAIYEAIRDGDPARAEVAAREHIRNALLERLKILRAKQAPGD
ncbi:GntR family transcriptional regulator [Bordetella genomosp. 8]|uniref:GntR family transcriptional regulator n=1 Tax=Bordetella genomosp. 8 TaxID=1416806 RepID=A0A1W6YIR1_9BORD|nr:GntR family transcriptional regulator [Bordetella genomosp. 8]ARP80921.1 GntR family transcriptional regulator [Bordetella genomosp. 8]